MFVSRTTQTRCDDHEISGRGGGRMGRSGLCVWDRQHLDFVELYTVEAVVESRSNEVFGLSFRCCLCAYCFIPHPTVLSTHGQVLIVSGADLVIIYGSTNMSTYCRDVIRQGGGGRFII